jgi:hypothetical protein
MMKSKSYKMGAMMMDMPKAKKKVKKAAKKAMPKKMGKKK